LGQLEEVEQGEERVVGHTDGGVVERDGGHFDGDCFWARGCWVRGW
jgi:hypothetical protein